MKNTRILLTLFLLCLFTSVAYSQNCRFDKDEIDGFTKEHHRTAMVKIGKNNFRWWIQMEQEGSKYYMTFYIFQIKDVKDIMPKGDKILAKLEDGKILEFEIDEDIIPVPNVEQQAIIVTQWTPKIELTNDQLKALSTSPIELIRTTIADKDVDAPEIKEKQGEQIKELANCFLQKD